MQAITDSHALTLHSLRVTLLLTGKANRVNTLPSLSKGKTISKYINMDKTTPSQIPSDIRKHYYLCCRLQNEFIHT